MISPVTSAGAAGWPGIRFSTASESSAAASDVALALLQGVKSFYDAHLEVRASSDI